MFQSTKELLPSYLDGPNISNHCAVVDGQHLKVLNKVDLLRRMMSFDRPILVERVQDEWAVASFTVHVNTLSPIRSIHVVKDSGDIIREYSEDDVMTEVDISFTEEATEFGIVMPDVLVTVETYDGITYTKGYPENDVRGDNVYDHDEALDKLGTFLGLPRRIYKKISGQQPSDYENTYPSYFAKFTSADYYSEDDFYYRGRLEKFVDEYPSKPLPVLMAELLYEWNDSRILNMIGRTTSIYDTISEIADENVVCIVAGNERYVNMDYTNMESIIQSYASCTRIVQMLDKGTVEWAFDTSISDDTMTITGDAIVMIHDEEETLSNAPFSVLVDDELVAIVYTDSDGEFSYELDLTGMSGVHTLQVVYNEEYELVSSEYSVEHSTEQFTVNTPVLTLQGSLEAYLDESTTLSGTLTFQGTGLVGETVKLYDPWKTEVLATATTTSGGAFTFTFTPVNPAYDGLPLPVEYEGSLEYNPCESSVTFVLIRHDSILTVQDVTGTVGDTVTITVGVKDENNNNVNTGTVEVDFEYLGVFPVTIEGLLAEDAHMGIKEAVVDTTEGIVGVTLQITDDNYDLIDVTGAVQNNSILLQGTNNVTLTLPSITYEALAYAGGLIYLEATTTNASSILDTVNGTVTIGGTVQVQGQTSESYTITEDYTEVSE